MSNKIKINIDGREVETTEGEYILNAARANDIFIPAICYLTRCSPSLACRLCLVEADGKQVYACNAKSKEGMNITTLTDNIQAERRSIMEVYDVNHPLQCGVCDQSGECELQNYTLEMNVDFQSYSIKDVDRSAKDWGHIHYDPGLCIVCERCVTVCKDMIGDNALKTVPRGADAIDATFKESMPKDAYAMWNKLNKSVIGTTSGSEMLDCTSCGECASVCPVGALVDTHFMYESNAWELRQIPATCGHCSAGCHINYDVKHTNIVNSDERIYRVMNEWNYVSLCGGGRYGFDYQNDVKQKDNQAFKKAIEAFKQADTIRFTSMITNEEALILQTLKEKFGYKLINEDARQFKLFLDAYSKISGTSLYGSDLKQVHSSNFVVSVGTALKTDNPVARYAFNNSIVMNKGAGLYFHPVKDPIIDGIGKNVMSINYAPLAEEAVLYLLLDLFADKEKLPKELNEYLASFHSQKMITVEETIKEKVTETVKVKKVNEQTGEEEEVEEQKSKMVPKKISKEIEIDNNALLNIVAAPENFTETLDKFLNKKDTFSMIIGADLYTHPKSSNLARLVALIEKYTPFELVMIPTSTNTLGVSLICDLDESAGDFCIGYNTSGDFVLSALGNGNLDMPAMNQQEGTFTNIDKYVVPTNAALSYYGYELNDIANALDVKAKLTVEYTQKLPKNKGFCSTAFDDLDNFYKNDGTEMRGYRVDNLAYQQGANEEVEPFDGIKLENSIIYLANPVRQFNEFTNKATNLNEKTGVYMSESALAEYGLKDGQNVIIENKFGTLHTVVVASNKIDGMIVLLPTFDLSLDSAILFQQYRFAEATIKGV